MSLLFPFWALKEPVFFIFVWWEFFLALINAITNSKVKFCCNYNRVLFVASGIWYEHYLHFKKSTNHLNPILSKGKTKKKNNNNLYIYIGTGRTSLDHPAGPCGTIGDFYWSWEMVDPTKVYIDAYAETPLGRASRVCPDCRKIEKKDLISRISATICCRTWSLNIRAA